MSDNTPAPTAATPDIDYKSIIQQIMQGGGGAIQGPAAPATPAVNTNLPVASLLGEALGGGVSPLYPMSEAQQTQAGNAALLNFGIGMLQNSSGPVRHSLGQAIASGLLGAQGSLAGVREGQAQTLDVQNKQQEMHLKLLEAAMPFLRMQQAAGMPNPLDSSAKAPGGGLGATGAPIGGAAPAFTGDLEKDRQIIAQRESGGDPTALNYVARADPTAYARGATASGKYQFVNSTWQDGLKLAGLDPSKYPTAMSAPEAIQDQVFTAVYKRDGTKPWDPTQWKQNWVKDSGKYTLQPTGGPSAAPTATTATTPPAPVAKPTAAPAAPAGTIQGTPDSGGTQVGGPGALPGVIRPPGPLVLGDVKTIIGGMTGAGANAATLAPGGGTAAPIAPPASTVVANNAPVAQQPTQADQPPPIGGQTWEQFLTQHMPQPTPEETATWHQAPDPQTLAEAAAAKTAAAQELSAARFNFGAGSKEANTANERYQTASKEVGELQRQYSQTNATTLLDWTNKQKTLLAPLFKNQQDQAQAVAEADKQRAAAIALKTQEGQQAIDLAKVNAGQTWHQKLQEQSAQNAQENTLKPMAEQAAKAHNMNLSLAQLQPLLQDLPPGGGALGTVLNDHPELAPLFNSAGILNDKSADAVRLVNGLVANISTQMKPTGLGALREYEWDAFKSQLPSMLSTPAGQQKAIALLMNMNNRIGSEASWMNNYFSRKVPDDMSPKPGAMMPAHNLESDNPTESVQQRMDRELGPIVPSAPPGSNQAQWEQSLPPGKPYYKAWALPDPKNPGQPLRDQTGNVRTTKTLEVRPWQ